MPLLPEPAAVPPLLAALAMGATDRRPDGGKAGRFHYAVRDGVLWLFPVHLPPLPFAAVAQHSAPAWGPCSVAEGYWLAHALRQDVWRALRRRRNAVPFAAVALAPERSRPVLAGALLARGQRLPHGCLDAAVTAQALQRHARWARVRASACAY